MIKYFTFSKTGLLFLFLMISYGMIGVSQVLINDATPSGGPYKIDNEKTFEGSPFYSFLVSDATSGKITTFPKKRTSSTWVDIPMPSGDWAFLEVLGTVNGVDWITVDGQDGQLGGIYARSNNSWNSVAFPTGNFSKIEYLETIGSSTYFVFFNSDTNEDELYKYENNSWANVDTPSGFNSFYFANEIVNRLYFVLYNLDRSIPAASDFSIQYFDGTNWTPIANPTDFTAELHFINYIGEAGNHLYFSYQEEGGDFGHTYYKLLGGEELSRVPYTGDEYTFRQVSSFNDTPVLEFRTFQSGGGTVVDLIIEENGNFVKVNIPGTSKGNSFLTKWGDKYYFQIQDANDVPKLYYTSDFKSWTSVSGTPSDWNSSTISSGGEDNLLIFINSEFEVKTYQINDPKAPCGIDGTILSGNLSGTFHVIKFIETDGKVQENELLTLKAGEYITLTQGFEVPLGSSLEVIIEACPNTINLQEMETTRHVFSNQSETQLLNPYVLTLMPNPVEAYTNITYQLSDPETVNLYLVNTLGQKVMQLENNVFKKAGLHQLDFQATVNFQGTYFLVLETKVGRSIQKMMVH